MHLRHAHHHDSIIASVLITGLATESWIRPDLDILHFGRCTLGICSYATFLVHNLCESSTTISLSPDICTTLRSSSDHPILQFFDVNTEKPLSPPLLHLKPLSSISVKVGIYPSVDHAQQTWLSLQNLHNPIDVWYIRVIANATAETDADGLFLSCGPELDFGDCYANRKTWKDIIMRNDYTETVNLSMLSDQKDQITFEILPEGLDGETVHVPVHTQADLLSSQHDSFSAIASMNSLPGQPTPTTTALHTELPLSESGSSQPSSSRNVFSRVDFEKTHEHVDRSHQIAPRSTAGLTENLTLIPGQQKSIRIWYLPLNRSWERRSERSSSTSDNDGKFHSQRFQLIFRMPSEESRIVTGLSRVCESIVRLEKNEVHLGKCNVLVKYKTQVNITNCSDLQARLGVTYVSQCVVASAHEIFIEPKGTFELELDFVPRQVNPDYHKEVTITNFRNPNAQNLVFKLRANCIDRQGVSLQALFYKILAPHPTNEIDFGTTVANHPAIRMFTVRNTTRKRLVLELQGGVGVATYIPTVETSSALSVSGKILRKAPFTELAYECFECSDDISGGFDWEQRRTFASANALVDPDVDCDYFSKNVGLSKRTWKHQISGVDGTGTAPENVVLDDRPETTLTNESLLEESVLEESEDMLIFRGMYRGEENWRAFLRWGEARKFSLLDSIPMQFSTYESEIRFSETQFRPLRRLRGALLDGYLEENQILSLEAGGESIVVVSMTLSDLELHGSTKTRSFERFLAVRMLEYDSSRLADVSTMGGSKQLHEMAKLLEDGKYFKPREIVLTVRACKSRMRIEPLRQLNFGTLPVGEQKDKTFTIVNLSEVPLLYEITKTGNESCKELRLNVGKGGRGVVRPYFMKYVPFIFAPSFQGPFEERIVVSNRLDPSANCELIVKASCIVNVLDSGE